MGIPETRTHTQPDLSQAIVLLLFSSVTLHYWLENHNLPALPLVPVSSTQAVIGAIIGIGLAKGGRNIDWHTIGKIVTGWITAPLLAMIICFIRFIQIIHR